jgi:hypothetical protein
MVFFGGTQDVRGAGRCLTRTVEPIGYMARSEIGEEKMLQRTSQRPP